MAKRILPATKAQKQGSPFENVRQPIRGLLEKSGEIHQQIRNLEREEIRVQLQRAIAQGLADPLPEITITPEETQAVSEYLYWSEGLLSASRDAVSALRGAMELVLDEAQKMGAGESETGAKYGQSDLWNSYHPLYSAVETMGLLAHRLMVISDRVETSEWELPERLRETKKVAEEIHRSDFGR